MLKLVYVMHVKRLIMKSRKTDVSDDMKKGAEESVQDLTNTFTKDIDEKLVVKEKEIMTV